MEQSGPGPNPYTHIVHFVTRMRCTADGWLWVREGTRRSVARFSSIRAAARPPTPSYPFRARFPNRFRSAPRRHTACAFFFSPVTSNTAFVFILIFLFSFFAHEQCSTAISFYRPVEKNMLTVATAVAATTITSALETTTAAAAVAVEITSL